MSVTQNEKAVQLVLNGRIHDEDGVRVFMVEGRDRDYWVVERNGRPFACTCPAGQFGRLCYHRMGVEAYLTMRDIENVVDESQSEYGF